MKRLCIILAAVFLAHVAASAQDSYYAEMLSRNNYYGTARSIGLGGAMTALGGDLGSVMYNPAGSSVNDYCQFTITPGLLFSVARTSYDPTGKGDGFGYPRSATHAKFNLPNIGFNLVFYPVYDAWYTSFSLGVVANTTNTFLGYTTGRGVNDKTSFLGSMAAAANGLTVKDFGRDLYAAYHGNQIGEYGPEGSLKYVGSNQFLRTDEAWAYVPGAISQVAIYNTYGSKTDIAINLSFNIHDRFFFGANVSVPTLSYCREEIFSEAPEQPEAFSVFFYDEDGGLVSTNYRNSTNTYRLYTDGVGLGARFGLIALITERLRFGAAFQTPLSLSLSEQWEYLATTSFDDSRFDASGESSIGEKEYNLRTPYVVDAGIAYVVPGRGLISIDYELSDYSTMTYYRPEGGYFGVDVWNKQNYINSLFCGFSHGVRAGVEFKPLPFLAFRAGYSFVSDPERYWLDGDGQRVTAETWKGYNQELVRSSYFDKVTHAVSLGAGFSSAGPFFADLALRLTSYPTVMFSPYYYGSYNALDREGTILDVLDPLEKIDRSVVDAVLTLGWRF